MNEEFTDFLAALIDAGARFLVVGAHALAVHGVPRATGDLDVWIEASPDNAPRVWAAMQTFGVPLDTIDLGVDDLSKADRVVQIGLPPRRIDVMTEISGVEFDAAWPSRKVQAVGSLEVPFLGRADLVMNKKAAGRRRDLADLEGLGELE